MTTPTKEKFADALELLVTACEGPLAPEEMIGPLKQRLTECRMNALSGANQHGHAWPPVTEAALRKLLELEDYEPLPKLD